jgi:hypothetical protein
LPRIFARSGWCVRRGDILTLTFYLHEKSLTYISCVCRANKGVMPFCEVMDLLLRKVKGTRLWLQLVTVLSPPTVSYSRYQLGILRRTKLNNWSLVALAVGLLCPFVFTRRRRAGVDDFSVNVRRTKNTLITFMYTLSIVIIL